MRNLQPKHRSVETLHPSTVIGARVLRHNASYGLSTLYFADGELRVPMIDAAPGSLVNVVVDARDVSIALSRPMDISISNRLPGQIVGVRTRTLPYVLVEMSLGATRIVAMVTTESVERLGLEAGVRAWAMIKAVAIDLEPPLPKRSTRARRLSLADNQG